MIVSDCSADFFCRGGLGMKSEGFEGWLFFGSRFVLTRIEATMPVR